MTLLRRITTATAATALTLVAIGGVVRATGSGDACPEWPGCFPGRVLPPLEAHALIEFSHRLVVVVLSFLIVAAAWVAWRRERRDPAVFWPIAAAVGVIVLQSIIGAIRIEEGPKALIVTLHFLTAMALVALVVVTATAVRVGGGPQVPGLRRKVRRLAWWTLGATALLLLAGAYVRGEGAGLVFLDWPLMEHRLVPDLSAQGSLASFLHRILAAAAVVLGGAMAWRVRGVADRQIRVVAWIGFGLLVAQAALGAAAVVTRLAPWARAGHVAGASLAWAALVALVTAVERRVGERSGEAPPSQRRVRERVGAYVQLTKPDIIVLLLITTVPAMVLAQGGMPPSGLILATLLGGSLAAAGANAINCYLDRDIDGVMARTRGRPLPSKKVAPAAALRFGLVLVAASIVWLGATVNLLSATLAGAAAAFYVLVYTAWMKRSTPQNIVIGGAAGAVPALVGWSAVTGTVGAPAMVLFGIVLAWTPPHFWALALRHAGDYRAAGIPMLPAVRSRTETTTQIVLYSALVVAASLLLAPVAGLGALYLVAAVALGGLLVAHALRVRREGTRRAMALFRFSITYLAVLFAAAAVDELLRA